MKRSDPFTPLAGNEELKSDMTALLCSSRVPHAVLITGETGTGRRLAVRLFAAAYLGDEQGLVLRGVHPDFIEVTGTGSSGEISVESVRSLLYELNRSAVTADGRRVAFINDASRLNKSSANALLKMLEEPPDGVLFLLRCGRENELLPTILSRCARLRTRPLPIELCKELAVDRFGKSERVGELCEVFGGRLGMVENVLSAPERLSLFDCARRFSLSAARGDRLGALSALDCAENREQLKPLLFDSAAVLKRLFEKGECPPERAERLLDGLSLAIEDTDRNINIKLLCAKLVSRL